jgi:hypothetical protein
MIVLRECNGARRHSIKSAPADEPVRIAHVQGARVAAKARRAALFNLGSQPQPPIAMARSDFGYTKFTRTVTALYALQRNMDFFSSSRKVLAPL